MAANRNSSQDRHGRKHRPLRHLFQDSEGTTGLCQGNIGLVLDTLPCYRDRRGRDWTVDQVMNKPKPKPSLVA